MGRKQWALVNWSHDPLEEMLELMLCLGIIVETALWMCVQGKNENALEDPWNLHSFVVALIALASFGYALLHLGPHGDIEIVWTSVVMLRLVLHPLRALAVGRHTLRVWEMRQVDTLQIDFSAVANRWSHKVSGWTSSPSHKHYKGFDLGLHD